MEIKYNRTFAPQGKLYSVGEIQLMLGYALEIMEPRVQLAEGKLALGENAMILFGITPEEYAWRQNDIQALNRLAEQMRREVPADRLIGFQLRDIKGTPVKKEVKLKVGKSIDGGAFAQRLIAAGTTVRRGPVDAQLIECRRLQQLCATKEGMEANREAFENARRELATAMRGLDKWFVAYDALANSRWPFLGFDGRIEVFTNAERADAAKKAVEKASGGIAMWNIMEIPAANFENFFKVCAEHGTVQLRVDNGFAAAELGLRDFGRELLEPGVDLRNMILREISYGVRWKNLKEKNAPEINVRGALESMLTMRNFVYRTVGNAVLYAVAVVPQIRSEGLCTPAARAKMGAAADKMQLCNAEKCAVIGDGKSKQSFFAVFTSVKRAAAFAAKANGPQGIGQPVAMVFDEIVPRIGNCDGLMIDVENFGYRIRKADIEKVMDLRTKPPMVVKIKPEEKENAAGVKIAPVQPAPQPVAGMEASLPDPDQFDLPKKAEEPEEEKPELLEADEVQDNGPGDNKPRKGFLRKIFGGKK